MGYLETLFLQLLNMGITASYVILAVLLLRICLSKAPKKFSYALWAVVGFRLLCPVSFSSIISIFNLLPKDRKNSNTGTIQNIPMSVERIKAQVTNTTAAATAGKGNVTVSDTAASTGVDPMQIFLLAVTIVWMIGIAAFVLYSIFCYLRLKHSLSKAVWMKDNIYECDTIPSPFVLGIVKPKIYIPFRLGEQEFQYILLHEQYHIRRFDYLIKPLSFLLLTVYWFHPLVWVAYYCMNKDMEMSCDEKVISEMGMSVKNDYSISLLSFAANHRMAFAGPLSFGETSTKSRIKNILRFKKPKVMLSVFLGLVCLLIVIACAANPFHKETGTQDGTASNTTEKEITDYARKLYECKNPYIGNASANGKLMNALGVSDTMGSFTIEMETSAKPYVLRLNFDKEVIDRNSFDLKMFDYATVLLALIDNADEIQWSYPYTQDGKLTQITVYWNSENLKVRGIDDIKSYAISVAKVQELLNQTDNLTSNSDVSYAENVTDNQDGKPQDKNILTMNDILAQKNWKNLTFEYFSAYENAKTEEFTDENALNAYLTFTLSYGEDTYELQVSYLKEDNSIDSILLVRNSDSDGILLYSADPKYTINTDVKTFLNKKVTMSQYLTYQLPDSYTDGSYSAVLGYGGGNLFYKNGKQPKAPASAFAPMEWYAYGGVLRLPYSSAPSTEDSAQNQFVTFKNGKLIRGYLYDNHTETIGDPIPLNNVQEQAVIMEVQHDLYTAAELGAAEEAGKVIPTEDQTSTMYEIYFARENGNAAYCIFLNKKYFTLQDAKSLAETVRFKDGAFE